jgi:hypothetical protein
MIQESVIDAVFVSIAGLIFTGFVFLQKSLGDISQYEEDSGPYLNEKSKMDSKNKSFLKKRKK